MTSRLLPKKTRKALCTWALTKAATFEQNRPRGFETPLRAVDAGSRNAVPAPAIKSGRALKG